MKMLLNKSEFRSTSTLKLKRETTFLEKKKISNDSLHSKLRHDRTTKPKLERSIPILTTFARPRPIKLHNCMTEENLSKCKSKINLKRKSISLIELPSQLKVKTPTKTPSKEQGDEPQQKVSNQMSSLSNEEDYNIARKACKMFILHAWRKRRAQVPELEKKTQKLVNEVQLLNVQTAYLRRLLESEKLRVVEARSDSSHLKDRLDSELSTVTVLRKDLSMVQTEKSELETTLIDMQFEINSLKEQLETTREINKKLEDELADTQNELTATKESETKLMDMIGVLEVRISNKTSCVQELKMELEDHRSQISELNCILSKEKELRHKDILNATKEIVKRDEEINKLQNYQNLKNKNIIDMRNDLITARKRITEQEDVCMFLENTLNNIRAEQEETERKNMNLKNQALFNAIRLFANFIIPDQRLSTI